MSFWTHLVLQTVDPQLLSGESAGAAASAGVSPVLIAVIAGIALIIGIAIGFVGSSMFSGKVQNRNKSKWPRDWPKMKDIISNNPDATKPGYMSLNGKQGMGSGAMFIGRTYPRLSLFPDMFPFRELRRRVQYATSKPVWIPYQKRFQHFSVLGATGKGKSTSFAIPTIAYGALERGDVDTSYYVIDVKSPQFARMFGPLYKKAGKEVLFFDPWSIDETLGFEPLWRASVESKDIISEVISTYSAEGGSMQSSENSEFFKLASTRLLRALLDMAQFWPRRYCNLPSIYQAISAGGDVLLEAFQVVPSLLPTLDETLAAVETVLPATSEDLRSKERNEEMEAALAILERSGYKIAFALKQMRRYEERGKTENISREKMEEVRRAFWAQIKYEWQSRKEGLNQMMMNVGEFLSQPEDTRNSVVSTITNKVGWFRDPNIARAFSRDELDIRTLTKTPCLFLVGAPMAKLKVGSLFVASIISNLVTNAVFARGMAIERNVKGVSKHGVFMLLDEFPQLQIKDAPSMLATFRGFISGVMMVFQERGQLKQLYGEDATTMEGNTVHKVLLQGAHEETAEFYAQKAIGEVQILKKSESGQMGEKKNVSESIESVPLMSTQDVKSMKLNGRVMPGMALSVGADVPAFPMRPIPFYEDPTMRKLLNLRKNLIKKGFDGKRTWKFWQWGERWEPVAEGREYLTRRTKLTPAARAAGQPDPVYDRMADPYTQYLDYILGRPKEFDELVEPRLILRHVGVVKSAPQSLDDDPLTAGTPSPGAPGGAQKARPEPTPAMIAPVYATDLRVLFNVDFRTPGPISSKDPGGISIHERIAAMADDEES